MSDRVKVLLSARTRSIVRKEANQRLQKIVNQANTSTFDHVRIFDEHELLLAESEWVLGRRYYDAKVQHPTVFSQRVAQQYRNLIVVQTRLMNKKLAVCDLDNTLWEGEIGEGEIKHFLDRQKILKRLRNKGVLLAINSKNDPANVHWRGAVLGDEDFVASQINWDSKASNMKRIGSSLNLKLKDAIFLDDRADQRELVTTAIPELFAMDATAEQTWHLLDLWEQWLPEQDEMDRTQAYRERQQREEFLAVEEEKQPDSTALLAKLELSTNIRYAKKSDLKRIVELVNRTNQFNLNASRTSFNEMAQWLSTPERNILIADGADKFGQMGTVCIAATEMDNSAIKIPLFVLSCRAFGYGIETAMLQAILQVAQRAGIQPPRLVGLYQETPLNGPCRAMYPDHGFVREENIWIHKGSTPIDVPSWLRVLSEYSPQAKIFAKLFDLSTISPIET